MNNRIQTSKRRLQTKRFKRRPLRNEHLNFDNIHEMDTSIFINDFNFPHQTRQIYGQNYTISLSNKTFQSKCYNSNNISQILPNLHLGALKNLSNENYMEDNNIDGIITIIGKKNEQIAIENRPNNIKPDNHLIIICKDDGDENIQQYFKTVINFINSHKSTFIHCQAGISRSVSLCMAYLLSREDNQLESAEQALKYIKECRSIAGPNLGFMWQVDQFYKKMIKNRCERNRCIEFYSVPEMVDLRESVTISC